MARVALVTGGTRGIGAAISKGLKAAGYNVAANYGSSDEAAQKFKTETGINVYKWDVSSFDACAAPLACHVLSFRRPALRRNFVLGEIETRRDGTADERPIAGGLRRLPDLGRHHGLRT